jgi:hypothetical protein
MRAPFRRRAVSDRPQPQPLPDPMAVLLALADPVVVIDRRRQIRMVNPAAE